MMCAGHESGVRDSCVGDSGGPLVKNFVVDGDDAYYQVGIVSFGFECGKPNEPGIYARVTEYTDWIHRLVIDSTVTNWCSDKFLTELLSAISHYDTYLNNWNK